MSGDSILTLTNQLLGFLIVGAGIFLALYPLEQKKHKLACLSSFVVMGLAVVMISTLQSNRASQEQADLRNQIERIRSDNHKDIADVQARLDAVVAAVKTAPPNANIKTLSEKVTKIAAPPQPIRDLRATVE